MRLVSFREGRRQSFGALLGDAVLDLGEALRSLAIADGGGGEPSPETLVDFFAAGSKARADTARVMKSECPEGSSPEAYLHSLDGRVELLAPLLKPSKIIAIGRNYRDHAREAGGPLPDMPRIFAKWATTIVGPGQPIIKPRETDQLDWEVEMAVVIGRPAHCVPVGAALDYVGGYTIALDITARDIQHRNPEQLTLGKNFRTFTPMGAWVVTSDEVSDPSALDIQLWVNDVLMQDSNTKHLIFDVPYLVSFLSNVLDLEPGDVISTGSPSGVGAHREPPIFLQPGDHVRAQLGGVCELETHVVDAA